MKIENLMEKGETEELLAFLSSYLPMTFSDVNSNIPKINAKEIDELIAKGPENYILPECVNACESLWEKNIYVLASMNVENDLYLILDKLSKENMKIFKEKYVQNPENYCINLGKEKYMAIKIFRSSSKQEAEKKLENLISDFQLQDIQRGYLTEKTFLMNICDCEKVEGLKEYKKQDVKVVFDVKKMEKSFKEYLKDSGYENYYIPEEHRIYINDYYYNAHKNYINKKDNCF